MSDENTSADTPATKAKAKAGPTVYTPVVMKDGRTVEFAGNRQQDKTVTIDEAASEVSVRFDFRTGDSFTLSSTELDTSTRLRALGHGLSQKVGDSAASTKNTEDAVLAVEEMIGRLKSEGWSAPREAGDSFAGASIVIRALSEVTGKDVPWVKAFLAAKLEKAKAAGEKLTRSDLYAALRDPDSATGKVIARMEAEDRAKTAKVSASDLMAEAQAAAAA